MGGKVLVPTREAIAKLVAARLAADVLGVPTLIIARTDALAAELLTNDADAYDRRFLTGDRTVEGFYRVRPGIEQAIARGVAYAPYADLVWCETQTPDLVEARQFAEGIHQHYPGKLLAYNCSPSFNWKRVLSDEQIASYQRNLAAMGYKFQFVTLAGFHAVNMSMFELAHAYRDEGMLAYSRLQQREFELERDHGYRAVKHQTFVGAGYFDAVAQIVSAGQTSLAALHGSTEQQQFTEKTPVFSEAEIHHVAGEDRVPVSQATALVHEPETT
jgi:isocitrate lyase